MRVKAYTEGCNGPWPHPPAGMKGIHLQHDLGGKKWPLKSSSPLTPAAAAAGRCATAHPHATAGARTDGIHEVPWAPPARNRSDGARVYLRRMTTPATPDVLEMLVENHRRFLAFLERRVGSREVAEDILQDAFVRSLERVDTVRDREAVIPWFYRLLRNAVIDHYRRGGAEDRALAYVAGAEDEAAPGADEALRDAVCACVASLVETLKPEYATVIKRVDLDGEAVSEFAREVGITAKRSTMSSHHDHATHDRHHGGVAHEPSADARPPCC